MLAVVTAAVVDAAAGHDVHLGAFADEEVVINLVLKPSLGEHHRDMDAAVLAAGGHININAVLVGLALDADGIGAVAQNLLAVHTDIDCALRLTILHVCDGFQQAFFNLSQHTPLPSIFLQQDTVSCTIMG